MGITLKDVIYELTESIGKDIEQEQRGIALVREYEASIALDDYGSGETTFGRVRHLNPDIVKIDKGMVQHFDKCKYELNRLMAWCRSKGIKVVAEGIETQQQLIHFKERGVHYFQGFLLVGP